ncbi:M28 family peptidase [Kordiimonas sp. SCSIO 12610]|uniref:M28 family peptidase n=1 Tax=Kordiimonas sp. SCSIO 12610 TaxID=2829597 RepID=UPI00210A1C1B|nr:M28 family peptidase [Kordiimonas sp. SCSIO 12610]UTW55901.1 M28 family peptidase [Kordiimonas sp. SCSIO 12610]
MLYQRIIVIILIVALMTGTAYGNGNEIPFTDKETADFLQATVSGTRAKHDLTELTRHHRMRGSVGYKRAANYIKDQLKQAGLDQVELLSLPADGETFYGTQRSRKAWNAKSAELWQLEENGRTLIARYADNPVILAQDSVSGNVTAELVDVGAGVQDDDFKGKDIEGKLVLTSSQPGATAPLAITKYGAAGIISYAQNQKSAWWKADDRLIRWGHLDSFGANKTFGIMVSLRQARAFQKQLRDGKTVKLQAQVDAERSTGSYDIVYGRIDGANPAYANEAIAFSCHLDHQRPGANDNASGCATILEIARSLMLGIKNGSLERPARPILFFWPPEIEGTIALLNARPDFADSIKSVIHMDMVGGGRVTKAIFRVSRGPASRPSFVNDVAEGIALAVNDQTERFASGEDVSYPLVAQDGGREAQGAITGRFSLGSDHQVYSDSSFAIPSIYLHDWPDRFIHTNFDTPANIDTTKLKRAGFIGAASALTLSNWGTLTAKSSITPDYITVSRSAILKRAAITAERASKVDANEASNLWHYHWQYEEAIARSSGLKADNAIFRLIDKLKGLATHKPIAPSSQDGHHVFKRNKDLKGPMFAFGYNYLTANLGADEAAKLSLPKEKNLWGASGAYGYEALNLVDGKRSVQEIRNILSAEFGPVSLESVLEYLKALKSINVIEGL